MAAIKLIAVLALVAACNAKCSFKATVNSDRETQCPEGYKAMPSGRWGAQCFKFMDTPATFAEAKKSCKSQGALLGSFSDDLQYRTMMANVFFNKESDLGIWLGAQRLSGGTNSSYYLWFDGQQMGRMPQIEPYRARIAYYPGYGQDKWVKDAAVYDGDCVQMVAKVESEAGKWRPVACDDDSVKLNYYCQKSPMPNNPEVLITGGCEFAKDKNFIVYN